MTRLFIIGLCTVAVMRLHAQGCSDAGFCTIGSLKQLPATDSSATKHKITLGAAIGLGDDDVFVCSPVLQYDLNLHRGISVEGRLSGSYASGRLGSVAGAGDIIADVIKTMNISDQWKLKVLVGVKIPLSNSDLQVNGRSLPMQYQSSLGTYDVIAGATFAHRRWQLSAGCQQPLSGANGNRFSRVMWSGHAADAYPESDMLDRRGDILLKGSYSAPIGRRWAVCPGALLVYHLGKDRYYDAAADKMMPLDGSEGLTLNATLNIIYTMKTWTFGLVAGRPLVVRDIRPDGLTRSIVLLPEISYKF